MTHPAAQGGEHDPLPAVFRAETVFHLMQSLILAARLPDGVRPVFSLDTTLAPAIDQDGLAAIGEVLFEERPKSRAGRLWVVVAGMLIYRFLPTKHDYYGPILNRPLALLRRFGRPRHITLLNEGRFSDPGPIRSHRNHIYDPGGIKRCFGYFVNATNPAVTHAVFTENSAPARPKLAPQIKETYVDVAGALSTSSSAAQAAMRAVFGHQISFDVTRFSTLVVLPYVDVLSPQTCATFSDFLENQGLAPDQTLFKIHPRTRVPADMSSIAHDLNIETGTYPIELLLLFDHQFEQAFFINTSTNVKGLAKEKVFLDAL